MPTFPRYTWDARLNRYRSRNSGRLVGQQAIQRALDTALDQNVRRARLLAEQERAGEISVGRFEVEMRDVIKTTQLYSAAAAKGGWAQLTPADLGRVGGFTAQQYAFLDQFVNDLRTGLPRDGRMIDRATQYAEAGRRVYHEVQRDVRRDAGDQFERNVLHPAEHCGECPGLTGRALGGTGELLPADAQDEGWVPIGSIPAVGQRQCRQRDRCSTEYRGAA
jgi:hypothetical protein